MKKTAIFAVCALLGVAALLEPSYGLSLRSSSLSRLKNEFDCTLTAVQQQQLEALEEERTAVGHTVRESAKAIADANEALSTSKNHGQNEKIRTTELTAKIQAQEALDAKLKLAYEKYEAHLKKYTAKEKKIREETGALELEIGAEEETMVAKKAALELKETQISRLVTKLEALHLNHGEIVTKLAERKKTAKTPEAVQALVEANEGLSDQIKELDVKLTAGTAKHLHASNSLEAAKVKQGELGESLSTSRNDERAVETEEVEKVRRRLAETENLENKLRLLEDEAKSLSQLETAQNARSEDIRRNKEEIARQRTSRDGLNTEIPLVIKSIGLEKQSLDEKAEKVVRLNDQVENLKRIVKELDKKGELLTKQATKQTEKLNALEADKKAHVKVVLDSAEKAKTDIATEDMRYDEARTRTTGKTGLPATTAVETAATAVGVGADITV